MNVQTSYKEDIQGLCEAARLYVRSFDLSSSNQVGLGLIHKVGL